MVVTAPRPRVDDIPLGRIRRLPKPGTATEADVIQLLHGPERRICELVDGTLVEKVMGMRESFFAMGIVHFIATFLDDHPWGIVGGPDGPIRMLRGNVRLPDVSYFPWDSLPNGDFEDGPIYETFPALAVEVLSESNTASEIARKIDELFEGGTQLIWVFDPREQTTVVYTAPDLFTELAPHDVLTGEPVLPGFRLPLAELFAKGQPRHRR
jgi:Uma2 family endonuclease